MRLKYRSKYEQLKREYVPYKERVTALKGFINDRRMFSRFFYSIEVIHRKKVKYN